MSDLQSIRRSLESAASLKSIVSTMKALASANILQFQAAAEAAQGYRNVLDMSLGVVVSNGSGEPQKELSVNESSDEVVHIVFGSDYGLAGRFNERIASFALEEVPGSPGHTVVAVGHQVPPRLDEHLAVALTFGVPQTTESISSMVHRLLTEIESLARVTEVWLYYNRPVDGVNFVETKERLMPLDPEALAIEAEETSWHTIPEVFGESEGLMSHLLQQYFFIALYRAFCFSLAAENTSRLSSMQSAEKNITELQEDLNFRYRLERQNSITAEINDVISGFRAIRGSRQRR